ncbi:MAG: substrate-binding domain-containing protein [bacterium]|nr:substrate-binding domain-containing protein [bacterium]
MTKKRRVAVQINLGPLAKHHVDIYAGCRKYAAEANWDCVLRPFLDMAKKDSHRGVSSYDGVIGRISQPLAGEARRYGTPVVNVWMNSPDNGLLPGVFADFESAGAMAANHLLGRGFRNFGFKNIVHDLSSGLALKGFRSVVEAAGFSCSVYQYTPEIELAGDWDAIVDSQQAWIDTWQASTGICCLLDTDCRYLIGLCEEKGLHVPGDVAVIGIGNEEAICLSQPPTTTSIELDFGKIGYQAAQLLDRLMDGEQPPDQPLLIKPHGLIPRQSTDSYAAEDPIVARALRYITEHCHEPITVADVVDAVPASHRSLGRLFQTTLGRSISDELLRLRIGRAKRRLLETDEALKNVSRNSGFSNYPHFYRAFVRIVKMSPKEYRKQTK